MQPVAISTSGLPASARRRTGCRSSPSGQDVSFPNLLACARALAVEPPDRVVSAVAGSDVEGCGASLTRYRAAVPDCVGLSLAWLDRGATFTLVATDEEIAVRARCSIRWLQVDRVDAAADNEHKGLEVNEQDLLDEGGLTKFVTNRR